MSSTTLRTKPNLLALKGQEPAMAERSAARSRPFRVSSEKTVPHSIGKNIGSNAILIAGRGSAGLLGEQL